MELYKGIDEKGEIIWNEENRIKAIKAIVEFITELCPDLGPYYIAELCGQTQDRMLKIHWEQMDKVRKEEEKRASQEITKMMCTGGNVVSDLLDEYIKKDK